MTPSRSPLSIALLWLPVLGCVAAAFCLIRADGAITDGAIDLDPLYGLTILFIVVGCAFIALVPIGLAIAGSITRDRRRTERLALGSAAGTAVFTALFTAYVAYATAHDSNLVTSTTAGDQYPWQVAAAIVGLAPLVVVLVVRAAQRAPRT